MSRPTTRRRAVLCVEPLETRDAPATLVGPYKLTYQDMDGDNVTVTFSKPILTAANVNTIFTFATGTVDGNNATRQQLRSINLTGQPGVAGTAVTTIAKRNIVAGSDGYAHVGEIIATGIDLGAVTVDGDLGRVIAGDGVPAISALKGLTALSLGHYGPIMGAADLHSVIQGNLGFLRIKWDVEQASVDVQGGKIGPVMIGGRLVGGAEDSSGRIAATGKIGLVTIKGDVVGGDGFYSGMIHSGDTLAGVSIGGSLRGGNDQGGLIMSYRTMGPVNITGNIVGGAGSLSGVVYAGGALKGVTVGGSVQGGDGHLSGSIRSTGATGPVKIAGDMVGAGGMSSGAISSNGPIAAVTIGGSVFGGWGAESGEIDSNGAIGAVKIGGNVSGGGGAYSGSIRASNGGGIAGVTIGGSLIGGSGNESAEVYSNGPIGLVQITGDVGGGIAQDSGIVWGQSLAAVTIGGSLLGGTANMTGVIGSERAIGPVRIAGDLVGGSASGTLELVGSGFIRARRVASLTIGGSLIAGINNTTGAFSDNGAVRVQDDIGPILIKGNIFGNDTNPAVISARGSARPTATSDVAIRSLTVLGRVESAQILAGVNVNGVAVNADAQIGPVFIGLDLIASSIAAGVGTGDDGYFGTDDDVKFADGGVKDVAGLSSRIASVTVHGEANGTFGGTDHFGIVAELVGAVNADGTLFTQIPGPGNDVLEIGSTGDLAVKEI